MRRVAAVLFAGILTLSLGGAVAGATSRSSFNGDFDVSMGGVLVGHITAQTSGLAAGPGTYTFRGADGTNGSAVIGEASFIANAELGYNEVWFKALEVGYPTAGYGIFIGHFVDRLDLAETDYVEFWSAPIDWDFTTYPDTGGTIGVAWHGTMDVGAGAFVLKVRVP